MKHLLHLLLLFLWITKDFTYLGSAISFINALPEAQRERAYVLTISSNRASALNGYYTVIYPDK
jgi:hypothetical protein